MLLPNKTVTITNAGGTETISVYQIPDVVFLEADGGSVTLAAPFRLDYSALPPSGSVFSVIVDSGIDLNGQGLTIYGNSYTTTMQNSGKQWVFKFKVVELAIPTLICQISPLNLADSGSISGAALVDGSVALSKLADVTDGSIVAGGAGNVPTELTVAGVLSAVRSAATLVYSYVAGSITNAAISASAAIDRSKLATGTASQVVVNDGSGVMTSVAEVTPVNGGTGKDTSASTGFATVSAGTWSVGAISEVITVPVSWESGEQCNNRVKIPFAGTVTNIYAVVTKALSGTDAGTIVPKNAASTNMTLASALSFAASSALETAIDTNVSANNTVAAGDIIYLTTAKTTVGGKALVSITITRTS